MIPIFSIRTVIDCLLLTAYIEYFNTKRAYTSRNGLTAEQFRNQAT
ncbi:IS3 family transposase [Limosilactobacillus reuteri]